MLLTAVLATATWQIEFLHRGKFTVADPKSWRNLEPMSFFLWKKSRDFLGVQTSRSLVSRRSRFFFVHVRFHPKGSTYPTYGRFSKVVVDFSCVCWSLLGGCLYKVGPKTHALNGVMGPLWVGLSDPSYPFVRLLVWVISPHLYLPRTHITSIF